MGGARPGAGRKPGVINESKRILQSAIDRVAKKRGGYEALIDKLWELVEGVEVEQTNKRGETSIYSQPPDAFAAKILLEFRFGKAPQAIVGVDGEKLEGLKIIIVKNDSRD